jgi:hypothetical protein
MVSPLLWWLNISLRFLNFTRANINQEKLDKEIPRKTQRELNSLYENPNVDFAFKFSYIFKTVLMTFFYIPLLPACLFISFVGLIFTYLVEKNNIIKNYKRPEMPNETMAEYFIDYFKIVLFVYTVTSINLAWKLYISQ